MHLKKLWNRIRTAGENLAGKWEFPGGKFAFAWVCNAEDGEGLMAALQDLFADMVNKETVDSVLQIGVKKA